MTGRPAAYVPWPEGVGTVVAINFDFQGEEHYSNLAPGFPDYRDVYERHFDGQVGIWRTLETL